MDSQDGVLGVVGACEQQLELVRADLCGEFGGALLEVTGQVCISLVLCLQQRLELE